MWRIATCVYRAFRNTATHRCAQDVLIPLTTVCHSDDDDEANPNRYRSHESVVVRSSHLSLSLFCRVDKCSSDIRFDIDYILKNNHFSHPNIDKLQKYLTEFSLQQVRARSRSNGSFIAEYLVTTQRNRCAAVDRQLQERMRCSQRSIDSYSSVQASRGNARVVDSSR